MVEPTVSGILLWTLQGLLALTVAGYVLWPLLQGLIWGGERGKSVLEDGEDQRAQVLLDALQDVEYEHETGKIDREEYERLREHYGKQLLDEYSSEEIDRLLEDGPPDGSEADSDDEIEAAVREARERLSGK